MKKRPIAFLISCQRTGIFYLRSRLGTSSEPDVSSSGCSLALLCGDVSESAEQLLEPAVESCVSVRLCPSTAATVTVSHLPLHPLAHATPASLSLSLHCERTYHQHMPGLDSA